MSWTLTVTQLNEYVRRTFAGDPILRDVRLTGEISGFKKQFNGHWYFTVKDEGSRLNCVMFRTATLSVGFTPAEGDRVVLTGSVGLYVPFGTYQFTVTELKRGGQGDLYLRFEELKRRLLAEGLFDEARKKPLPLRPRVIAVVTSKTGAVIHDIARVAGRRDPSVQLILRCSLVQGEGAAPDIARGIRECAASSGADIIIVGRGGGSLEDLWAFNEEEVVRAVWECPIPVISAVGHEVDVTLCDLAADVRAATPSAAAEIAVPDRRELKRLVSSYAKRLESELNGKLNECAGRLANAEKHLTALHPKQKIRAAAHTNDLLKLRLENAMKSGLEKRRRRASELDGKLTALGPRQELARGYAVILAEGRAVTSVRGLKDRAEILMADGRAAVKIESVKEGDPFDG